MESSKFFFLRGSFGFGKTSHVKMSLALFTMIFFLDEAGGVFCLLNRMVFVVSSAEVGSAYLNIAHENPHLSW